MPRTDPISIDELFRAAPGWRVRTSACALIVTVLASLSAAQSTERVNLNNAGMAAQGGPSPWSSVSLDGSRVAFSSSATNLAAPDTNGSMSDVFVRDRDSATTIVVSQSATVPGATANGASVHPKLSANGKWVAFTSNATNLVAPISPNASAVWLRDLQSSQMLLASRRINGSPANALEDISISGSGRYVAYSSAANDIVPSDTNGQTDAFVFDRTTLTTIRASLDSTGTQANGNCYRPALSQTGRYVVFESPAANFGAPNTTWQIFLKDLQTGALTLVSRDSAGVVANGNSSFADVSADGRYVVFVTDATNLFPGDLNGGGDIIVRDVVAGVTELASANGAGAHADLASYSPDMTADGRTVVFHSNSSNLSPLFNFNAQVYLRDRRMGTTEVVSLNSHGAPGTSGCLYASVSDDGRFVAFASDATNLVLNDGNAQQDVFLRDRRTSAPWTYGIGQTNSHGCQPAIASSGNPSASASSGFLIQCNNELNQKIGLLFYGTNSAAAAPYLGGFVYVQPPTVRTATQSSAGSASGVDCTGHFSYDFNARIASHVDPNLVAGRDVWAQYWSRDSSSASTTNLSDAIVFAIGP